MSKKVMVVVSGIGTIDGGDVATDVVLGRRLVVNLNIIKII
jgi:hypothetical protein